MSEVAQPDLWGNVKATPPDWVAIHLDCGGWFAWASGEHHTEKEMARERADWAKSTLPMAIKPLSNEEARALPNCRCKSGRRTNE